MAQCRSEAEVLAFLSPKLEILMQPVAEGMREWNEKEIDRVVYAAGSPEEYFRTYQFRDVAWHESVEGGILFIILVLYRYLEKDFGPLLGERLGLDY